MFSDMQVRDTDAPSVRPEVDTLLPASAEVPIEPRRLSRRIAPVVGLLLATVAVASLVVASSPGKHGTAGAVSFAQKWGYMLGARLDGINKEAPHCVVLVDAVMGAMKLEAHTIGISPGDWLLIGKDEATGERRQVTRLTNDRLRLDVPLEKDHPAGTSCDQYDAAWPAAGEPQTAGPIATTPSWSVWYDTSLPSVVTTPAPTSPPLTQVPTTRAPVNVTTGITLAPVNTTRAAVTPAPTAPGYAPTKAPVVGTIVPTPAPTPPPPTTTPAATVAPPVVPVVPTAIPIVTIAPATTVVTIAPATTVTTTVAANNE